MGSSIPGAFAAGREWEGRQLEERRARQEAPRLQQWQDKYNTLQQSIDGLKTRVGQIDENTSDPTLKMQREQLVNQLGQLQTNMDALYKSHPWYHEDPHTFRKLGRLLHLSKKPAPTALPAAPSVTASSTVTVPTGEDQPVSVPGVPAYSRIKAPGEQGAIQQREPGTEADTVSGLGGDPQSLTIPAGPPVTVKESGLTPAQLKGQAQARMIAAGLGPKSEAVETDEAMRKARIDWQTKQYNLDQWLAYADKNLKLTPEAREESVYLMLGLKPPQGYDQWTPLPGEKPYKDPGTGQNMLRMRNKQGMIQAFPYPGPLPAQRMGSSAFNEMLSAYAKSHNINVEDLPPEALDYVERKMKMDQAMPTATTTTTLKQNADGFWVPVTETNYRTPGGNVRLVDPLGAVNAGAGQQPASPSAPQAAPRAGGPAAPPHPRPAAPGGAGSTKVGAPLFAAPNKELNDARSEFDGAVKRADQMDKFLVGALQSPPNQQAMLGLVANHIGMTMGQQKGAKISQTVWNEAVESRPWLAGAIARFDPNSGLLQGVTLAPDQARQMVQLAHEQVETLKANVQRIEERLKISNNTPNTPKPQQPRKYKDGKYLYTISPTDVQEFLRDHPHAQEVK